MLALIIVKTIIIEMPLFINESKGTSDQNDVKKLQAKYTKRTKANNGSKTRIRTPLVKRNIKRTPKNIQRVFAVQIERKNVTAEPTHPTRLKGSKYFIIENLFAFICVLADSKRSIFF